MTGSALIVTQRSRRVVMIKKLKSGCYKVEIPIYEKSFYVALCSSSYKKQTGRKLKKHIRGGVVGHEKPILVLIARDHNTIAHECHHMLMTICLQVGILPNNEFHEATAYLQGYITEQVYKIIDMHDN